MADGDQSDAQTLEERWVTLLSRLSPVAVIAVHHGAREGFTEDQEAWRAGTGGDTEGERAVRRACARAEVHTGSGNRLIVIIISYA